MRVNSAIRPSVIAPVRSPITGGSRQSYPMTGLIGMWKLVGGTVVENIGLSVEDYTRADAVGRSIFWGNDFPIPLLIAYTWENLIAAVSAEPTVNEGYLLYSADKQIVMLYEDGTSREILNKALRYLGLPQIYDPFGPTWSDAETWDDNKIWTES